MPFLLVEAPSCVSRNNALGELFDELNHTVGRDFAFPFDQFKKNSDNSTSQLIGSVLMPYSRIE